MRSFRWQPIAAEGLGIIPTRLFIEPPHACVPRVVAIHEILHTVRDTVKTSGPEWHDMIRLDGEDLSIGDVPRALTYARASNNATASPYIHVLREAQTSIREALWQVAPM